MQTLIIKDFKDKYLGSYLGITWAFIQPTVTIIIFWFIFQVGFKSTPVDGVPFILWLISGMLPWFFFSEALQNATNSIVDHKYLIKNIVFNTKLLPIVKIVSSFIIHLFFVFFMLQMFSYYGYPLDIHYIQIVYYIICSMALILSVSLITSSIVVFFKDMGQVIAMVLQLGYWMTPVFWSLKMIPHKYEFLIKLNPVFYITEGYRNSLLYKQWFWNFPTQSIYFWAIIALLFAIGSYIFSKLRVHFNDML
jgi:ABC-type polysaccharide/polyol phosphate export permease